jgi:hypothetical protein
MRGLLGIFPGARGDSITGFDGRDLYSVPQYRIWFSGARGTRQTGGIDLFTFPFGVMPGSARVRAIQEFGPRKSSIQAEEVLRLPPHTEIFARMSVTLPEGWRARVPANVVAKSDFGTYSTEYKQEGRVFTIVRTEISGAGVFPPSRLPEVINFFQATAADENNSSIVIDRKPPG